MIPRRTTLTIDRALLDRVAHDAARNPRGRTNFNFHDGPGDNPHRFLNALMRGSYCAPHRHLTPAKDESFLVLRGKVGVWLFDDAGTVVERYALGQAELLGVDIPAGTWHTVAALSPCAVCYEVKPGPWDPSTDKEFAPWAPREGDATAAAYLDQLLSDFA